MVFSDGLRRRNDVHAQFLGPLGELAQHAFAVAFLEVVLPRIGVFLAKLFVPSRRVIPISVLI